MASTATTKSQKGKASKAAAPRKRAPAKVAGPSVQLFVLSQGQPVSESGFVPMTDGSPADPLRWHKVAADLLSGGILEKTDYWGLWPSGYAERLVMSADDLQKAMQQHPDADVYITNAYPEVEAAYQNLWVQGAVSHPGLMEVAQRAFIFLGLDTNALIRPVPSRLVVTGHALIGRASFWKEYLTFTSALVAKLGSAPDDLKQLLFRTSADPKGLHHQLPFAAFFMERLLTVYLLAKQSSLKVCKIDSPGMTAKTPVFVRDMRRLKDLAIEQGSAELLTIWASYRQLWFLSTKGKQWLQQNGAILGLLPPVKV